MKLIKQKVYKEKSWQQRIFGHMCRSFHCKDIPQKGIIFTNTVGNKKTLFLQNFPSQGTGCAIERKCQGESCGAGG